MHTLPLVIIDAFCCFLLLLPLPMHIRARNTGTLLLCGWLFCGNLIGLINAILFWDSVANDAPVWCDITIKFTSVGFSNGLAACSLCIHRRLASIAATTTAGMTQRQKRISLAIDLGCCIVLPCILMAASYVVQVHRFDIIEGMSPLVPVWHSLPMVFLTLLPPLLICCASLAYGTLAMRFFLVHRLRFQGVLKSSRSGLDTSNYLRLMAIAMADLLISLPLSLTFLVIGCQNLQPWTSWSAVHEDFSRVRQISTEELPGYFDKTIVLALWSVSEWLSPVLTIIFFLFFGVSEEAIAGYLNMATRIINWMKFGRRPQDKQQCHLSLGSKIVRAPGAAGDMEDGTQQNNLEKISVSDQHDEPASTEYLDQSYNITVHVQRDVV